VRGRSYSQAMYALRSYRGAFTVVSNCVTTKFSHSPCHLSDKNIAQETPNSYQNGSTDPERHTFPLFVCSLHGSAKHLPHAHVMEQIIAYTTRSSHAHDGTDTNTDETVDAEATQYLYAKSSAASTDIRISSQKKQHFDTYIHSFFVL
jgi:hypothetical protein